MTTGTPCTPAQICRHNRLRLPPPTITISPESRVSRRNWSIASRRPIAIPSIAPRITSAWECEIHLLYPILRNLTMEGGFYGGSDGRALGSAKTVEFLSPDHHYLHHKHKGHHPLIP